MNWRTTDEKPERHASVLVAGVLEGDRNADVHEGFWNGTKWESVRSRHDGFDNPRPMKLAAVTHWADMPEVPNL